MLSLGKKMAEDGLSPSGLDPRAKTQTQRMNQVLARTGCDALVVRAHFLSGNRLYFSKHRQSALLASSECFCGMERPSHSELCRPRPGFLLRPCIVITIRRHRFCPSSSLATYPSVCICVNVCVLMSSSFVEDKVEPRPARRLPFLRVKPLHPIFLNV